MTVSELLNTESQWGQGMSIRRKGRMCLLEAIYAVYPESNEYCRVKNLVTSHLSCGNSFTGVVQWNDHPQRTFADIRQVIEALNI